CCRLLIIRQLNYNIQIRERRVISMVEDDVINRIQYFLEYKHWSLYKLAKEAGMPYASLSNIFNRKTVPSIPTLDRICKGFGINLAAFFEYDKNPIELKGLSAAEQDIINSYRVLSVKDKELLTAYLDGLCKR
ncbi:MAG: helix-turn-helix domain-containing protein, partial [Lachnospiraceae bacterium]|nr:helix-turn-helix domain-containing protein [Lachnospiraceae bacterium]